MKAKLKRHSRSALSVLLSLCMLVSCITVGMIGTDAAQTLDAVGATADEASVGAEIGDDESVGATYYLLLGTNNNPSSWNKYVTSSSKSFTVTPSDFGLSSFALNTRYYVGISSSSSYTNMYAQGGSSSATASGSSISAFNQGYNIGSTAYHFAGFQLSSAADSVTVTESGGSDAAYTFTAVNPTYTAIGDSTALFGTAWAPTATQNDMTKSGTTYTWTKSNVYLEAGDIEYKVAKDHGWTTTYPSENATKTVSTSGYYNVSVTYNSSTNAVNMTLTNVTPHTLTVASNANAVVTAKYNGTTVGEGGTLTVPPNVTVTVNVTPNAGYKLGSITSSGGGATSVSGNTGTLTMPAANTTLSVTLTPVGTKTIYFNNNNTGYSMVSVKYTYNGSTTTSTMTRQSNSNVWSIDVPEDLTQITFVGDNGYNTGALTIPWSTYSKPKYTAGTDKTNPASGGTWGNYTARANEVTVTNGSTINTGISNGTLFAGITATMYDYYADGEVNSGATNWLTGINTTTNSKEYSTGDNDWKWNSFTKLNAALSAYSQNNSVTYPLYFGNLNVWSDNGNGNSIGDVGHSSKSTITSYYNWNQNVNGSIHLSNSSDAVTGLSGKTLANSNIHYYKSGATNENGAIMAMFDEDFLSGENNQNAALATILRSSFPVRISSAGGTVSDNEIWLDENGKWNGSDDHGYIYAWVWGSGKTSKWVKFTNVSGSVYKATGVSGYTNMKVVSLKTENVSNGSTSYGSPDIAYGNHVVDNISITVAEKAIFKLTNYNSGSFTTHSSDTLTVSGGHTYYEFDSTDGKDNAYVTSITKPTSSANGTATLEYYNNTNKVYSASYGQNPKDEGFFPFDYNNFNNQLGGNAHDLGFGMKLEIPFTLEANGQFSDGTAQTFDFSGDDDLWVFIDGNLVLDLGGEHFKSSGSINFKTETVTVSHQEAIGSASRNTSFADWFDNTNPNIVHTMTLYYLERGMFDSNLKFGFSFHAIPNQLKTEKKVRTANINSGFYIANELTTSDKTIDDGREITWFEKSYQYEPITITQSSGSAPSENPVTYSLRDKSNTTGTLGSSNNYGFNYSLYNDNIAYFLGQYASGTNITLKETLTGTRYNYTPSVVVYDDANNQAVVSGSGDISTGYQFAFTPTVAGAIDNLNMRARVTNQMKSHDLTITKAVNGTDTSTKFKIKVEFNFDMAAVTENGTTLCTATTLGYHTYPLFVTLNGQEEQLYPDGTILIDSDDTLVIPKIPENAQMRITEVIDDDNAYGYKSTTVTGTGISTSNATKGVEFQMGTSDAYVVFNNYKASLSITHQLHPDSDAVGETYVSAKVKNGSTVVKSYAEVSSVGSINVDSKYIKKDSTNNLEIVLRSELTESNTNFDDFYEKITNTINTLAASGTPYTAVINKNNMTATVTVPIASLFNNDGTQKYNILPFYSKFSPEATYNFTVSKVVTGGDSTEYFPIRVDFNGNRITDSTYNTGEFFGYSTAAANAPGGDWYFDETNDYFMVKANKSVTFTNVLSGDSFLVAEDTGNISGYTYSSRSISGATGTAYDSGDLKGYSNVTIGSSDAQVTITNAVVIPTYTLKLTKTTDSPYDYTTAFKVRVQKWNGTAYVDLYTGGGASTPYYGLSGVDHNNSSVTRNALPYSSGGSTQFYYYPVHKGDVLDIPDITSGSQIRIIEVDPDTSYYHYNTTTLSNVTNATTRSAYSADGIGKGIDFTFDASDVTSGENLTVNINNTYVKQTVRVYKRTNFNINDGSTFQVHVKWLPYNKGGSYISKDGGVINTDNHVTSTSTTVPTVASEGKYALQKDEYVEFTNVPYGSTFQVEEIAYGYSNVTQEQRFTFDKLVVDGNEYTENVSLQTFEITKDTNFFVWNKIFKNDVKIKKIIDGRVTGEAHDTETEHTFSIGILRNGQGSASYNTTDDSVTYYIANAAGTEGSGVTVTEFPFTVTLKEDEEVRLHGIYSGSFFTVRETSVGFGYQYNSIEFTNVVDNDPAIAGLPNPTIDSSARSITFQTRNLGLTGSASILFKNEKRPTFKYRITYNYPSRTQFIPTKTKLYGDQQYFVEDTISGDDANYDTYFADGNITKALVQAVAPFETNFMIDLALDNANITIEDPVTSGSETIYYATATFTGGETTRKHVNFKLPYNYTVENHTYGKKLFQATNQNYLGDNVDNWSETDSEYPYGVPYQDDMTAWEIETYVDTDGKTKERKVYFFTEAPSTLNNNGTTMNFLYWSVRSINESTGQYEEVARCYDARFNYVIFDDYEITPVYDGFDSELGYDTSGNTQSTSAQFTTINLLAFSRNQWNSNVWTDSEVKGNGTLSTPLDGRDTVYVDFDVAFEYNNIKLKNHKTIKTGILIENCGKLDVENHPLNFNDNDAIVSDGKTNYQLDYEYYANKYSANKTAIEAQIKEYLKGNIDAAAYQTYVESLYGSDFTDDMYNSSFEMLKTYNTNGSINNMNRSEIGIGNHVRYITDEGTDIVGEWTIDEVKKNSVFRAYTYIKDAENNIILSEPVYFTVYNTAVLGGQV